jgi:hypothetical protein
VADQSHESSNQNTSCLPIGRQEFAASPALSRARQE